MACKQFLMNDECDAWVSVRIIESNFSCFVILEQSYITNQTTNLSWNMCTRKNGCKKGGEEKNLNKMGILYNKKFRTSSRLGGGWDFVVECGKRNETFWCLTILAMSRILYFLTCHSCGVDG